jgi:hypothetical protein
VERISDKTWSYDRGTRLLFRKADKALSVQLILLLALVCCSAICVLAQQPLTPAQVGSGPLTQDEAQGLRSNQLDLAVSSSESGDDGVPGSTVGQKEWSVISSVRPELNLQIARVRLQSTLHYAPSFTYGTGIATSNNVSQAAGLDMSYRFTKRLTVSAREAFVLTTNPFDSLRANAELPNFGVLDRPSTASLGTNLHSTTEQLGSDLSYRLTARTTVGAGGNFGDTKYETLDRSNGQNLDSRFWSGSAFVSHQWSPRYSTQLQYSRQYFSSAAPLTSESDGNEVLGFLNITWNRSLQLSVFGGPNLVSIDHVAIATGATSTQTQTFSGGASFSWQGQHNGLSVSFSQRTSNSGISGNGVVSMRTGTLNLQRQAGKMWSTNIFANYVGENQLDPLNLLPDSNSVSAGVGISRVINQRFTLSLTGSRQQFIGAIPELFLQRSRDIVGFSISYRLSRPIGR